MENIYKPTGFLDAPPADDVAGYILYFMFNFPFFYEMEIIFSKRFGYVFFLKRENTLNENILHFFMLEEKF